MRSTSRLVILCVLCVGVTCVARGAEQPALPDGALDAIQAGEWEKLSSLLAPLTKDGADPGEQVRHWYGVALFHQGKMGEAIPQFTAAIKANPRCVTSGQYLARAGRAAKSDEAIETAVAAFPADSVVLGEAAQHFFRRYYWYMHPRSTEGERRTGRKRLRRGIELARTAVALDPANTDARVFLAKALKEAGHYDEAIENLLIADRIRPLGWEAYLLLADCFEWVSDWSSAAECYVAVAKTAPVQAHSANWLRAMALWRADRDDEAVEAFRQFFRDDFMHTKVRYYLGRAAYDAGDYPLALFAFRESYQADSKLDALAWSARCAYELGQDELALQLIDRAIAEGKGRDKDFYVYSSWNFTRGRALWQLGRKKEAAVELEEAARKVSTKDHVTWAIHAFQELDDPFGIIRVVRWYGREGHAKEAIPLLAEVPKLYPGFRFRDHRGKHYTGGVPYQTSVAVADVYEAAGDYRAAWFVYKQIGRGSPRTANAWTSWVAVRADALDEARKMFEVLTKRKGSKGDRKRGHFGLLYLSLLARDGEAAQEHIRGFVTNGGRGNMTTLLRWAKFYAGDPAALDEMNAYDLLGVFDDGFTGSSYERGVAIMGLLPDSPLAAGGYPVKPRDTLFMVDDWQLRDDLALAGLKAEMPKGPTTVVIRRGYPRFEITVDLEKVREELRKQAAPEPKEEKEAAP